jgi:multidrug resistance efflux pump
VDRNELTLALTGAFFGAVLLGWVLHWIFSRLNRASGPRSIKQTALLVERVQNAEDAKLAAEARLHAVERDLSQRIEQMQSEIDAAHESLEAARDETEQIRAAYREAVASSG